MNDLAEKVISNEQHREFFGVDFEHTFWFFMDYWWVIAIIIILSIVVCAYVKES